MAGVPEQKFDDIDDFDDFDDMIDLTDSDLEGLEEQPDKNPTLPAECIESSSDARRKLEDYWERKNLEDELRDIDDWDDA